MAKKADLLAQAQELGLDVTEKNTVVQIEEAIASAPTKAESADTPEPQVEEEPAEAEENFAKSGKRSKKAVEEAQEQADKEDRIAAEEEEAPRKVGPKPKTRPKAERRSKKYKQAYALIDRSKAYSTQEAIDLAIKTSTTKFDGSVELHARLNVDPRQADQNVRSSLVLPAGSGKTVRVAVFVDDADVADAKAAGADIAGNEDFLASLEKGQIDFDVLVSAPNMMAKLSKYARILGPRGLMPNPKSGTVTTDFTKAIKESKAGKVEYRVDEQSIVHLAVGKTNFSADDLLKNLEAVLADLASNKPSSIKGNLIETAYLTTTMGPSIKLSV